LILCSIAEEVQTISVITTEELAAIQSDVVTGVELTAAIFL
jgi:hypothetical protein